MYVADAFMHKEVTRRPRSYPMSDGLLRIVILEVFFTLAGLMYLQSVIGDLFEGTSHVYESFAKSFFRVLSSEQLSLLNSYKTNAG